MCRLFLYWSTWYLLHSAWAARPFSTSTSFVQRRWPMFYPDLIMVAFQFSFSALRVRSSSTGSHVKENSSSDGFGSPLKLYCVELASSWLWSSSSISLSSGLYVQVSSYLRGWRSSGRSLLSTSTPTQTRLVCSRGSLAQVVLSTLLVQSFLPCACLRGAHQADMICVAPVTKSSTLQCWVGVRSTFGRTTSSSTKGRFSNARWDLESKVKSHLKSSL